MKILYIDQEFSIDDIRPAEYEIYFKELPRRGHRIVFMLRTKKNKPKFEKIEGNEILYRPVIKLIKIYSDIYLFFYALRACKKYRIDIILVRNNLFTGIIGLIVSRLRNNYFAFIRAFPNEDLILSYAGLFELKFKILRIQLLKIKKYLILKLLNRADLIFTKSELFSRKLHALGISSHKLKSIPMGFDCTVDIKSLHDSRNSILKAHNLEGKKIISYLGAMDKPRNLYFLIRTMYFVKKEIEDVVLLMIGGNNTEINALKSYTQQLNLTKIILYLGKKEKCDVYKYIAISDIGVSPIPPIPAYEISSPTKVIETLGMCKPVVANQEIYDQKKVISESKGGICVPYSEKDFANAIIYLIKNEDKAREMGIKGSNYIETHRCYKVLAGEAEESLIKLLGQNEK